MIVADFRNIYYYLESIVFDIYFTFKSLCRFYIVGGHYICIWDV